jgi:hypothetical protein
MRKVILVLLVGLFWCNVGFAQVIKYECSSTVEGEDPYDFIYYTINIEKNFVKGHYKYSGKKEQRWTKNILEKNEVFITFDSVSGKFLMKFNYGSDGKIVWKKQGENLWAGQAAQCISKTEERKIEIASMIDKAKSTCKDLGFKEGTEKFSDCSLKLYSQSVELAAKSNQTVVMQPQSSGSNTMTIYDPVRDSNALIKQGQRMLSGRCTLGIDC